MRTADGYRDCKNKELRSDQRMEIIKKKAMRELQAAPSRQGDLEAENSMGNIHFPSSVVQSEFLDRKNLRSAF